MSGGTQHGDTEAGINLLEEIGSKWRLIVLRELFDGERRFSDLRRATGANPRTLSRVLEELQERSLVERRVETEAPVATYYSLTPRGRDLWAVFRAAERWAGEWA